MGILMKKILASVTFLYLALFANSIAANENHYISHEYQYCLKKIFYYNIIVKNNPEDIYSKGCLDAFLDMKEFIINDYLDPK